ncbi:hypothetical protein E2C01_089882 [Portunus trituberculatus]|uniref:Uncharacterized protein n=1 Tax=Portunus trituberculatus TaxID=210409 RepID=A0A5B7JES3_PORTR|nr:hypothetical protein [Portunus trituberculatus]
MERRLEGGGTLQRERRVEGLSEGYRMEIKREGLLGGTWKRYVVGFEAMRGRLPDPTLTTNRVDTVEGKMKVEKLSGFTVSFGSETLRKKGGEGGEQEGRKT